jgi:hypothetical protein
VNSENEALLMPRLLALLLVLLGCLLGCEDILPVETVKRCEGDDIPADCSCADDADEMDEDIGMRAEICPECQGASPHPDCVNAVAAQGGTGVSGSGGVGGTGPNEGGTPDAASVTDGGMDAGGPDADAAPTGCLSDEDCGNDTPACRDTGECVGCTNDEHCAPAGKVCDEATFRCEFCVENGDCDEGDRRFCKGDEHVCVECLADQDHCGNEICDPGSNTCVECLTNEQCASPDASRCTEEHVCDDCDTHGDCALIEDLHACNAGTCVECTVDTEDNCGGKVCDLRESSCTQLDRGLKEPCEACEYDSECMTGDAALDAREYRCVAMNFNESSHGSYCLELVGAACAPPYGLRIEDVVSTSGAPADDYCGIDQQVTTCEAVRAISSACPSGSNDDCGAEGIDDGLCRTVGSLSNRCTIPCSFGSQCPNLMTCGALEYCH